MTEFEIQKRLYQDLSTKSSLWIVPNSCVLGWESDLIAVSRAGVMSEYEIKISKADFKLDAAKQKHEHIQLFQKGIMSAKHSYGGLPPVLYDRPTQTPANYFWYACPAELIQVQEVPEYAGLLWLGSGWRPQIVKKPPKLHSNKITQKQIDQMARSIVHRYWRIRLGTPAQVEQSEKEIF